MKRFSVLCMLVATPGCFVSFNIGDAREDEGEGEGEPGEGEGEGEGEPFVPDPLDEVFVDVRWALGAGDVDLFVAPVDDVCAALPTTFAIVDGNERERAVVTSPSTSTFVWVHAPFARDDVVDATVEVRTIRERLLSRQTRALPIFDTWMPLRLDVVDGVLDIVAIDDGPVVQHCLPAPVGRIGVLTVDGVAVADDAELYARTDIGLGVAVEHARVNDVRWTLLEHTAGASVSFTDNRLRMERGGSVVVGAVVATAGGSTFSCERAFTILDERTP